MLHTRRFDSESDDESVKLVQKALYIEPLARPIDLNTVPMTGSEYIHLQRLMDSKLSYYLVNNIMDNESNSSPPKPKDDLKKWRRKKSKEFSSYASDLKLDKETLKIKFPKKISTPKKNEKEWCAFCLGFEMCSIIYDTQELCSDLNEAHSPVLSIVLHLSQCEIQLLLKYLYQWFKKIGMIDGIGKWIYALLACLEEPFMKETTDILENFHHTCKSYYLICDESQKYQVNLIVGILENHFSLKAI